MERSTEDVAGEPSLATVAFSLVVAQAAAIVVMVTWFDPTELPSIVTLPVPLLSGVAALLIGWDATTFKESGNWWRPRPWAWAFAVLLPGLNLGFGLGYLLRRSEVRERTSPSGRWLFVLAPAVVVSAAAFIFVSTFDESGTIWESILLVSLFFGSGALALSIVAAYYDVRFVTTVLETAGSGWRLRGYHWVPLVTIVLPANALILGVYYLRRRRVLDEVETSPERIHRER